MVIAPELIIHSITLENKDRIKILYDDYERIFAESVHIRNEDFEYLTVCLQIIDNESCRQLIGEDSYQKIIKKYRSVIREIINLIDDYTTSYIELFTYEDDSLFNEYSYSELHGKNIMNMLVEYLHNEDIQDTKNFIIKFRLDNAFKASELYLDIKSILEGKK